MNSQTNFRYEILDALRGIAALSVLCYHLFEGIAFASGNSTQEMYHGFLAVDFFFILSGFVMGHAYDRRWKEMSAKEFVLQRIIRLHPMVVMGVLFGIVAFLAQGCTRWDGTEMTLSSICWASILALLLIPSPACTDLRGNTEMFPLNGPHWSLFFEYIGSFCYAFLLRRLSDRKLTLWVLASALALAFNGFWQGEGMIAYGWSVEPANALGGALRLSFGYPAGLLMARFFRKHQPQTLQIPVFTLCSIALLILLCVPYLGKAGLFYQLCCIFVAFPLLIWWGARGKKQGFGQKSARFLGRLSYPLYAIHYPLIYLYIHWINTDSSPFGKMPWCTPVALFVIAVTIAIVFMLFYDEPLRKTLSSYLKKSKKSTSF